MYKGKTSLGSRTGRGAHGCLGTCRSSETVLPPLGLSLLFFRDLGNELFNLGQLQVLIKGQRRHTVRRTMLRERKVGRRTECFVVLLTLTLPCPSMTAISMFLAPVCTTSSRLLIASLMVSSFVRSSLWFFSRNSRTVFEDLPIAFAWNDRKQK